MYDPDRETPILPEAGQYIKFYPVTQEEYDAILKEVEAGTYVLKTASGSGSWFGMKIPYLCDHAMTIFIMPAGGFFVLGCLIALVNKIAGRKPPKEISCEGCPNASACKGQCKVEEGA